MNENDGSIIIDTELDSSGFQKGSEKLIKAVEEVVSSFDNLGDNVMTSLSKVVPLLQSIAGSASQISAALTGTATQTEAANEKIVDSEQRVSQSAEEAAAAINKQGEAASVFSNSTKSSVSSLEKEVNSLSTSLQSVSNSAETGFANGKAVLTFDAKLQALEQRLATAREHLAAFGNTQIPTEDYTSLTQQIEKAEQALFKMYDRREDMRALGVKENSAQWKRLSLQIANAEAELTRYERERETLTANGGAFISGAETAEYAQMKASLDGVSEALSRNRALINQEALEQARLNVLTAQEAVASATTTREREAAVERLRAAQEALNDVASSMSNNPGSGEPTEEKVSMWSRLGAAMKSAASTSLRIAANIAKIPFTAAAKGVQKLGTGLKNYISHSLKAKNNTNALVKALTSLKRMLITRVKRMFISEIFNQAKESLQTMAKYSDTFNSAMSNIKNRSKEVSGNIAVTLGNIITKLEPLITRILDAISKLFTYINGAFALLSGKSTMTVAKKQTDNYRDSLDDAAKSAKELKNQVYGFDELNKRSDNNDNTDSDPSDGSNLFEEVPVDSVLSDALKDFIEDLKKLWEAGDFFGFGERIAEELNGMMQIVDDWINDVFRPKGKEWAKNIAEILNGLVDGFDWNLLGKTIADGLNAIADTINTFLTTFDFEKFGTGVGETIASWFSNVEWDLIGTTFANGVNSIVDTLHGLVNAIEWGTVGQSISEFFNNFATGIDWNKIVKTVSDGVKGLETAITSFVKNINFRDIADSLASSLDNLDLAGILTKAGQLISDLLRGVMEFAAEFIKKVDWSGLMQGLWDGLIGLLQNIDWAGIVSTAFELLGAAVGAAGSLVATLIANILELVINAFEDTWSYFSEYVNQCGGDIVAGLLLGILNALANIGQWIWEHIFKPFWDGLCSAFGIASPSTKMMEIGGYIIAGLLEGIKTAWNGIVSFFSTAFESIKTAISNAWTSISTTVSTFSSTVKTTLSTTWETVKTNASTAWETIKTTITTKFDGIKTSIKTVADNVKKTLTDSWTTLKSEASTKWKAVTDEVKNKYDALKTPIKTTTDTIKKTISDSWQSIRTDAQSKWASIKQEVTRPMDEISSKMRTAWLQIKNEASNTWESIRSTIMSKWNSLKSSISNSANSDWRGIGTRLVEGLKTGISNAWSGVTSLVSRLASGLTGFMNRLFGIHSPSKEWAEIGEYLDLGLAKGLKDEQGTVLKTVSNLAGSVGDEMQFENASLDLKTNVDDTSDKLNVIANTLSGIAETFQSITNSIIGMNGLKIPSFISGSVVPSRTAVSGTDGDVFDSLRFGSFTSDLDERLYDLNSLLEKILSAILKQRNLDTDEIANILSVSMGNVIRSYGGV